MVDIFIMWLGLYINTAFYLKNFHVPDMTTLDFFQENLQQTYEANNKKQRRKFSTGQI